MTVIDSMIEKTTSDREQAIADGWIRYSEILRADAEGEANADDASELKKLIDLLELSTEQIRSDRKAVADYLKAEASLESATSQSAEFEKQLPGVTAALDEIPKLEERIKDIRAGYYSVFNARAAANDDAGKAREKMHNLKETFPKAFGC